MGIAGKLRLVCCFLPLKNYLDIWLSPCLQDGQPGAQETTGELPCWQNRRPFVLWAKHSCQRLARRPRSRTWVSFCDTEGLEGRVVTWDASPTEAMPRPAAGQFEAQQSRVMNQKVWKPGLGCGQYRGYRCLCLRNLWRLSPPLQTCLCLLPATRAIESRVAMFTF